MPAPERLYRNVTVLFSAIIAGFGAAIVIVTLGAGGGPASTGFLLGLLFLAIGAGRLYIAARSKR